MGRRTLVLIVALLLAGVAAFAVWQFLTNVEEEVAQDLELVQVYRAARFIPEGTQGDAVLTQNLYEASEENAQFLPENAITSEDQLRAVLSGRVAAGPISAGQVLTTDQWVEVTVEITPLAELIPEGKQAITISVDQVQGVNGFIEPGDRINVIVTIEAPIQPEDVQILNAEQAPEVISEIAEQIEEQTITRFVLQGLPVLAVGREIRPDSEQPVQVQVQTTTPEGEPVEQPQQNRGILTLEVTPEEAERLVFAYGQGAVWLTLVPADFVPVPTDGITRDTLFEDEAQDLFGGG